MTEAEARADKACTLESALQIDLAAFRRQNAELQGRLEHADDLQASVELLASKLQVSKQQVIEYVL